MKEHTRPKPNASINIPLFDGKVPKEKQTLLESSQWYFTPHMGLNRYSSVPDGGARKCSQERERGKRKGVRGKRKEEIFNLDK